MKRIAKTDYKQLAESLKEEIESLQIIYNQEIRHITAEADREERKLKNQLEQSRQELDTLSQIIIELEKEKRKR